MSALIKHAALLAALDKREHEKVSETVRRFHHGNDANGANGLHAMLHQVGYYPAGRDNHMPDTWAAHRLAKRGRPLHQIGVHRKKSDPETHFTDIVLY